MIIYDNMGEISLGDLQDFQFELEDLQRQVAQQDPERDIRIWNTLKQIAQELEDPRVMKLPYARVYYPQLLTLINQIRKQLQINMAGSANQPQSWRLYRGEPIKKTAE